MPYKNDILFCSNEPLFFNVLNKAKKKNLKNYNSEDIFEKEL